MPVKKYHGATGWPSNTQRQTDISPGNLMGRKHVAHLHLQATKMLGKKSVLSR